MQQDESPLKRFGPIRLSRGVEPWHVAVFIVVNAISSCLIGYVNVVQPYILTAVLHVPLARQGHLTGGLNMAQYGAVALFIVAAGGLTDILGRKPVMIAGMIGFILTLVALPLVWSVAALFALRFFLGFSSTGHIAGSTTMIVDFPTDRTRGKLIGLMIVVPAVVNAALIGWLLPRTPAFLVAHGLDRTTALRCSLWGLAALGVIGLAIALLFLRAPPRARPDAARKPSLKALIATSGEVLAFARRDPTFGLLILISFVIRADFFVTQSFMAVWVMGASRLEGIDSLQALKTVGSVQAMVALASAVAPFFLGLVADRVDRMGMLIGALLLAALAYGSTVFVHHVGGALILVIFAVIGTAEMAQTVASQALFGERAPPGLRGSGIGFFVLTGQISVILVSYLSGLLFDRVGFTAPFLFLSALNLLFVTAALALTGRGGRGGAAQPDSAQASG